MKPEAQRIAIAEACGWQLVGENFKGWPIGRKPDVRFKNGIPGCKTPDYLNDLNAMHEAEKAPGLIVGPAEWDKYCTQLRIKIGRDIEAEGGPGSVAGLMCIEAAVSATAPQRAEAFLRTLNLWTD